jgi:hypothetical protein
MALMSASSVLDKTTATEGWELVKPLHVQEGVGRMRMDKRFTVPRIDLLYEHKLALLACML